jgi:protein-tyrosine phosphatase
MIDIHHHLLFGLDDGSPDLETSVAMVEAAAKDGITHIVCTPHANSRFLFDPDLNREHLEKLRARIDSKVTLGLGCDFRLSEENVEDALKNTTKYTINQKQYLLIEFDALLIPQSATGTLHHLSRSGQRPIITHPERNSAIQRHPERMKDWLREGALVQVTASSLTGRFGRTAQSFAEQFLERNWVHFLATDAHNMESRPPKLSEAYGIVAERYGTETAERLCVTNPRAVFFGEELGPQPELLDLESTGEPPESHKKGILSRWFSS